jgi:hypothetical protein
MREEVVRPHIEAFDADARVADMVDDVHQAQFAEGREEAEMQAAVDVFKYMMDSAAKPLHAHSEVSQLDAISRLMGLKSDLNMSREGFDKVFPVVGTLLPKDHMLPKTMYEAQKLLKALKMPYEQIHACPNGCVLFREEHKEANNCPKCKASRFLEVESGDGGGQKRQLKIPARVLRHLPFVSRLQRLFMTEETAKQMTWHKNGKRYNPDKMVHPFDGEAWTSFNDKHRLKSDEARNVRVALAIDGFNPYGMMAAPYTCWPMFVIPLNLPLASPFNDIT